MPKVKISSMSGLSREHHEEDHGVDCHSSLGDTVVVPSTVLDGMLNAQIEIEHEKWSQELISSQK